MAKLRLAIHKFTSCDGCQLAFLNAGEQLLTLTEQTDIRHFIEAGIVGPHEAVDVSFIEGSISTPDEAKRIQAIRQQSRFVISIGACATSGGIQALRNTANHAEWLAAVYATPKTIKSLKTSTPIAEHIKVDWEIWGCPVNTAQVMAAITSLMAGAAPENPQDALCMACKRQHQVCVMVAHNEPCMGPVTRTGCGVLCPGQNRGCYACYGPDENPNTAALSQRFSAIGLSESDIARKFSSINNAAPAFKAAANQFKGINIVKK